MLLSVIVPCYNVEGSVRKTLNSLLSQNFNDYEIIAVDDGSQDSTPQILKEFEGISPLVKVINKTNGGVSSARNVGLGIAQGEYIFFLDSDDYVLPNFFQVINDEIKKKHFPGILSFGFFWDKKKRSIMPKSTGIKYFKRFLLGYENIMIWSFIAKKSLYDNFELRFEQDLSYAEDYHLFYRLFYLSQDIHTIKKVLINYTDNANSAMHKELSVSYLSSLESFTRLYVFFVRQGETGFYLKAMKNILIQNYLSLRWKYLANNNRSTKLNEIFKRHRASIPILPPLQLSPFFIYNMIYSLILYIRDSEFRNKYKFNV